MLYNNYTATKKASSDALMRTEEAKQYLSYAVSRSNDLFDKMSTSGSFSLEVEKLALYLTLMNMQIRSDVFASFNVFKIAPGFISPYRKIYKQVHDVANSIYARGENELEEVHTKEGSPEQKTAFKQEQISLRRNSVQEWVDASLIDILGDQSDNQVLQVFTTVSTNLSISILERIVLSVIKQLTDPTKYTGSRDTPASVAWDIPATANPKADLLKVLSDFRSSAGNLDDQRKITCVISSDDFDLLRNTDHYKSWSDGYGFMKVIDPFDYNSILRWYTQTGINFVVYDDKFRADQHAITGTSNNIMPNGNVYMIYVDRPIDPATNTMSTDIFLPENGNRSSLTTYMKEIVPRLGMQQIYPRLSNGLGGMIPDNLIWVEYEQSGMRGTQVSAYSTFGVHNNRSEAFQRLSGIRTP